MTIPLILLTNGRHDCLARTVGSIDKHLTGWDCLRVVVDGSENEMRLRKALGPLGRPYDPIRRQPPHRYDLAMQTVFDVARETGTEHVAFWEDDFVLQEPVDLRDLAAVLDDEKDLAQMALLRQAWFPNEVEHGGLIEALVAQGHSFQEITAGDASWIEHRACFTGNPTVLPARTFTRPWPTGAWSESQFGQRLFEDPAVRCAYWGRRGDPPRVEHIGHERVGTGY